MLLPLLGASDYKDCYVTRLSLTQHCSTSGWLTIDQALDSQIMPQITTKTPTTKTIHQRSIRESIPGLCAAFFCQPTFIPRFRLQHLCVRCRCCCWVRSKQLMQRKPLCEPTLHVSAAQPVFVISASLGRRTVCVFVFMCGHLCVRCSHGCHPKKRHTWICVSDKGMSGIPTYIFSTSHL